MTSLKPSPSPLPLPVPWSPPGQPVAPLVSVRRAAAAALQSASVALSHLAARLAVPAAAPSLHAPVLEFHAEAGAPEGALFIDGELVGWLPGVTRL